MLVWCWFKYDRESKLCALCGISLLSSPVFACPPAPTNPRYWDWAQTELTSWVAIFSLNSLCLLPCCWVLNSTSNVNKVSFSYYSFITLLHIRHPSGPRYFTPHGCPWWVREQNYEIMRTGPRSIRLYKALTAHGYLDLLHTQRVSLQSSQTFHMKI